MAIDPTIPLRANPMQLESAVDQQAKAMQLRAAHDQMRKGQMEQEAYQRSLQEEQALRSYFASGKPVEERELFGIVGPTRGAAILKGMADLKTAQVKSEGELKAVVGSALGAIKALPENLRGEAYQSMRQQFIAKGWAQPGDMREQYVPEVLDRAQQWAMTPEQQAQDADRRADNARLDADQASKLPGVQADNTKKAADALDAQLVTEGRLLGSAKNNAEWQSALAQLSPERRRVYPPMFSREWQQRAVQTAQTAEERIQASQRQQQIGEQARHNRVMETASMLRAQNTGKREVTPTAALAATRSLRNDFLKETDAAKASQVQLANMESALSAVRNGSMQAGSQAVIMLFNKILDDSAVKEGEYARSQQGQSLLNAMRGKLEAITQGGAGVQVDELAKYVALARDFASNQAKFAADTRTQIDGIADEFGLKKELITSQVGGQAAAPRVGDVVTVRGQKVKITKINPDGTYEGVPAGGGQ